MVEELRKRIDELFAAAPKTRAAYDLKEELLANSMERYFDLVEDKVPEKDALEIVINSIGDIDELFTEEAAVHAAQPQNNEIMKKIALYKAIAVGLYIVSFCVMIAVEEFTAYGRVGFLLMMVIIAIATCILVYIGAAYPKYKKADDTVVEEFKEWNSSQKKKKSIQNSVSTIIWMITLVMYFLISFLTMAWHITWLMFLIGVCVQAIANLLFQLKDHQ